MLNRLQARIPMRWRLVLVALAVAVVAFVYYVAAPSLGGATIWLLAAIFLAVGLFLGFRAWLLAIAGAAAVYVGVGYLFPPPALAWEASPTGAVPSLIQDSPDTPGLVQLRREYALDTVVAGAASDRGRVARLADWVSRRFAHDSTNQPSQPDPLTILREGAQGKRFRCVEYSTVLTAAARSLGMPARVVGLKRQDVATARYGSGHVVAEVWLREEGRWVMADGQWNAVLDTGGRALSALEVQSALATRSGLRALPADYLLPKEWYYLPWLSPYLYYFDYAVDQRFFVADSQRQPGRVMLVPVGAPEPSTFGGVSLGPYTYVHHPALFYQAPE